MKNLLDRNPSMIASLAILILMCGRVIYFFFAPDTVLIGVIPDDAFYYIQLAKHREIDGFWTFDGTSPTTGFHFLYGYLLFILFSTFGILEWQELFLIVGVTASVFISTASYFVFRTAEKQFGKWSILFAIAPFLSTVAIIQSTTMMESWLVILFSATTLYLLSDEIKPTRFYGMILFIVGFLGSLSRTDYGMLPGVMFSMYVISVPVLKNYEFKKNYGLIKSGIVLLGSIAGVGVVLVQDLYISGHLLQVSAQTKFYWSSEAGHSVLPSIRLVKSVAFPIFDRSNTYFTIIISIILLIPSFWYYSFLRKSEQKESRMKDLPAPFLTSGCIVTIFAYIVFYRFNSQSLQPWYSANFIAPVGIAFASIGYYLFARKVLAPAMICFVIYFVLCIFNIFYVPWPQTVGLMRAGLFLKEQKQQANYGSWNAGIISYFSGIGVINLDGLTNDEVLPFIKSNTVFDYIRKRDINYLVDFEAMIKKSNHRTLGGYSDERTDRCLRPVDALNEDAPKWDESTVKIFEVIHGCN